jgi:transposase-like protein
VVFVDAICVKVRDGQVANKPFYAAVGVTVNGERDILGIWAGAGGEGAKYWLAVLTEIKNRGVQDVLITVCYADGWVMPMVACFGLSGVGGGFVLSA